MSERTSIELSNALDSLLRPRSDSLLEELEESIPQGRPNSTRVELDDDFADLEQLLGESLIEVKAKEQYAADLKAKKRGFQGMTPEEVAFCNSRMAAFEAARIWRSDRSIAVFARYECQNCGDHKTVFSRYMEHQKHRTSPSASRWIAVMETKLHPTAVVEQRKVPMCVSCAPKHDLDTHSMPELKEILK